MQYENNNQNEFKQRLDWVMAGRKVTPWAKNIGLTSGTMSRLSKGEAPGVEILTAIMRTENVNISWLIDGQGLPFIVDTHYDEPGFLTMLRMHDADSPYTVHLCVNPDLNLAVFVFTQPASYQHKSKTIEYHQLEIVVGPYSDHLRNLLANGQLFRQCTLNHFQLDDLEFRSLVRGQFGTFRLLGTDEKKGLVENTTSPTWVAQD